jgi:hypothetical protein
MKTGRISSSNGISNSLVRGRAPMIDHLSA